MKISIAVQEGAFPEGQAPATDELKAGIRVVHTDEGGGGLYASEAGPESSAGMMAAAPAPSVSGTVTVDGEPMGFKIAGATENDELVATWISARHVLLNVIHADEQISALRQCVVICPDGSNQSNGCVTCYGSDGREIRVCC